MDEPEAPSSTMSQVSLLISRSSSNPMVCRSLTLMAVSYSIRRPLLRLQRMATPTGPQFDVSWFDVAGADSGHSQSPKTAELLSGYKSVAEVTPTLSPDEGGTSKPQLMRHTPPLSWKPWKFDRN